MAARQHFNQETQIALPRLVFLGAHFFYFMVNFVIAIRDIYQ